VARKAAEKENQKIDPATMSVVDHLRELRDRIIW